MKVAFVRPVLRHLDEVAAEAIALGVFSDERPLEGVSGLVDWRLNGGLTRWIASQRFAARAGEALLYPDRGRLSFDRLLVYGLGPRREFDMERFRLSSQGMLRALRDLGVTRFAAPIPGRPLLDATVRVVMERWLSLVRDVYMGESTPPRAPEVLVIEDTETQRTTADTVQGFLRRVAR